MRKRSDGSFGLHTVNVYYDCGKIKISDVGKRSNHGKLAIDKEGKGIVTKDTFKYFAYIKKISK